MALVSCQQDMNSTSYCHDMNGLASCFDHTFLDLSVVNTREMCFGGSRRDGGMDRSLKPISVKGCRWNRLPTSNILEHIWTIHSLIRTELTRQWVTLLGKLRKDLIPAIALSKTNYGVFHCKLADMLKIVVSNLYAICRYQQISSLCKSTMK